MHVEQRIQSLAQQGLGQSPPVARTCAPVVTFTKKMDFRPFQQSVIDALDDCHGAIKHCAKNAISHLEKAWLIRDVDMEMAIFRGITAEEEAASALFHCLKNHRYKNADKLLQNQHTHKLGLFPFITAVGSFLGETFCSKGSPFYNFSLRLTKKSDRKAIELLLHIESQNLIAYPTPPLHFTVSNPETGKVFTFEDNFQKLIEGNTYKDAMNYVKDRASTRNRILYATNAGRPKIEGDIEGYLQKQRDTVITILILILMIDPWEKQEGPSLFVQQALDSFLLLLQRISEDDINQPCMR